MKNVESCALCVNCEEIEWADARNALRCRRPGKYCGRVTQVFLRGHRAALEEIGKPAWCSGFVRA